MRAHGNRFVLAAIATLLVAPVAGAQDFVPGQVIVKYNSNKAAGEAAAAAIGATAIQTLDAIGAVVLSVGDVDGAVSALSASGGVEYVEPNYLLQASVVPNDPLYGSLWGMDKIQAPAAWDVNTGDTSIIVAVIDTGIDYNHPDLVANVWTNPGEIAGNGIDDDLNGVIDDVHGFNAITGSGNPLDDNNFPVPTYHGTHVSGTIGAVGNNGVGVVGVNWNTTIMGCKFLNNAGSGSTVDAIECIEYTVDNGATVLNNSWGGGGFSQALADAIDYADQNGVLFVAASGNSSLDTDCSPEYPAAYDNANIISVASTTSTDGLSSFSNYGRTRSDLGAPGSGILSTLGNSTGYHSLSGTSMATPHVAGAAALTWAANPGFSHMDVKARLLASVDRTASLVDRTLTFGRLNVNNAVNGIIPDTDGDGIETGVDNCPDHNNPAQTDTDGDGIGDACDTDAPCPPGGGCGIVTVEARPGDGMSRTLAGGLLVGIAGAVVLAGRRRRA